MSSFIAAEEIRVREKIAFQIKVSFGNTFQEVIIKGSIINFINKFVACDNSLFIDRLLRPFAARLPRTELPDARAYKDRQYDLLADRVRRNTDMERLYEILSR